MNTKQVAKTIVKEILDDLSDRKGLSNEWDEIDEDIQNEIIESWEESTQFILDAYN